jgi:hypothetical protein
MRLLLDARDFLYRLTKPSAPWIVNLPSDTPDCCLSLERRRERRRAGAALGHVSRDRSGRPDPGTCAAVQRFEVEAKVAAGLLRASGEHSAGTQVSCRRSAR